MGKHCCLGCMCLLCFAFVGLIILCAMVFAIYMEYELSKGFEKAKCNATGTVDHGDRKCRGCTTEDDEEHCEITSFPCIGLNVTYTTKDGAQVEGTLHPSALQMAKDPECSYRVCEINNITNKDIVNNFIDKWFVKENFTCFYNPKAYHEVLTTIHYTSVDAFHSVFWAGSFVTLMLVMIGIHLYVSLSSNSSYSNVFSCCFQELCLKLCLVFCCICKWQKTPSSTNDMQYQTNIPSLTAQPIPMIPREPQVASMFTLYGTVSHPDEVQPRFISAQPGGAMGLMLPLHGTVSSSGFIPPPSYDQREKYRRPAAQQQLQLPAPVGRSSGRPVTPPPSYEAVIADPVTYPVSSHRTPGGSTGTTCNADSTV